MKKYKYPTVTVRVPEKHREMLDELKSKYYLNISRLFRDIIETTYNEITKNE